jgi:hypothetical protein
MGSSDDVRRERGLGKRVPLSLLAVLLVAVLVRLPGLFSSFWYDEVMYSRI